MAVLHHATLSPSKLDLLTAWVPHQPWFGHAETTAVNLSVLGSYRFDDPAGEVGIETHLLAAGPVILQVPMTYRAAPLPGPEATLIATATHSVLGTRWVYDATTDPVYATALATTVLTGGTQADVWFDTPGGLQRWEATTRVTGTGTARALPPLGPISSTTVGTTTTIMVGGVELVVLHLIDPDATRVRTDPILLGTWPRQDTPALLARARSSPPARPA